MFAEGRMEGRKEGRETGRGDSDHSQSPEPAFSPNLQPPSSGPRQLFTLAVPAA